MQHTLHVESHEETTWLEGGYHDECDQVTHRQRAVTEEPKRNKWICDPAFNNAEGDNEDESSHEQLATPEEVCCPSCKDEEASESEDITAEYPLQVFLREAKRLLD